jgi:3-methyladenine DNA glycosylase AlkD
VSVTALLSELRFHANPADAAGMARFGINSAGTLGVKMPVLRAIAKRAGRKHANALELWKSGLHEARILASLVDEPAEVTVPQLEEWVRDFDSWDVCDQVCMNLFAQVPAAVRRIDAWAQSEETFVRRAAFALIAVLAWQREELRDAAFAPYLKLIERYADDDRNFVKKAVNWALRQIGKRNRALNKRALVTARRLLSHESKAAQWIARDAVKELTSPAVRARL